MTPVHDLIRKAIAPLLPVSVVSGLFLITLTACGVSQEKYTDLEQRLAAREAELAQARSTFAARAAEADARIAEYNKLQERFAKLIDAGKLRIKMVDGRMVVELPSDILFPSARADLSKDGRSAIQEITEVLISVPGRRYQVEGHTDDWPIQTARFRNNWELSAGRAISVVRMMVDGGLDPERVSAAGYGDTRPVGDNETREGRALNRRIEIVIVPDLRSLPGYSELEKIQAEQEGAPKNEAQSAEETPAPASETETKPASTDDAGAGQPDA